MLEQRAYETNDEWCDKSHQYWCLWFMPTYRRAFVPGGTWFFTVALQDRRSRLLVERADDLRHAFAAARRLRPFEIDAIVVLPDHLHTIWTLPEDDSDFSRRWASVKSRFSRMLPAREPRSPSRRRRGERGIWQRRFWEHLIRDERDYERHVNYCYVNPVKHGLVARVRDWPHSSFHRDVAAGLFPIDWAVGDEEGDFGEVGSG